MGKVIVYVSGTCAPCQQVRSLVEAGRYEGNVELVNIETDDGFDRFAHEILAKGDGAVPSAYQEGKECKIQVADDDWVLFDCPKDDPHASPSS